MMTTIEEMKTLCDEATEGPWIVDSSRIMPIIITPDTSSAGIASFGISRPSEADKNANFTAASRTFVPEAIRVMEQMAEALLHYRDKYERYETFDNTSHDTGGSGYEYIDGPAQNALAAFDALGVE